MYRGTDGKIYSLDTQHGEFEVINAKTGQHEGAVRLFGLTHQTSRRHWQTQPEIKIMSWLQLSKQNHLNLSRGSLIRFKALHPFEDEVIMMICEAPDCHSNLGLMTITGYKAGINCYVIFPESARDDDATISSQWLLQNWRKWVWPDGNPDDVWVLPDGLNADAIK